MLWKLNLPLWRQGKRIKTLQDTKKAPRVTWSLSFSNYKSISSHTQKHRRMSCCRLSSCNSNHLLGLYKVGFHCVCHNLSRLYHMTTLKMLIQRIVLIVS